GGPADRAVKRAAGVTSNVEDDGALDDDPGVGGVVGLVDGRGQDANGVADVEATADGCVRARRNGEGELVGRELGGAGELGAGQDLLRVDGFRQLPPDEGVELVGGDGGLVDGIVGVELRHRQV